MTIPWIKCSERMPPDDDSFIVKDLKFDEYYYPVFINHLKQQTDIYPNRYEWTPYTEETWRKLNE